MTLSEQTLTKIVIKKRIFPLFFFCLISIGLLFNPSSAQADYSSTILSDSPVAYWRLGETSGGISTIFSDTFTDTNATVLSSHTSDSGNSWIRHTNFSINAEIQSNKVRNSSPSSGATIYYTSVVPSSGDYDVEANVKAVVASNMSSGVAGRISTSATDLYFLRLLGSANELQLFKTVGGASTKIGSYSFTPSNGSTYTLKLSLNGTTIKGYLDGVERISVTDSSITTTGRAGLRLGGTSLGDDTIDNMSVYAAATLVASDSSGNSRNGTYLPASGGSWTGGTLGVTGALTGDSNTSATFDGVSGYVSVPDNAALKFGTGSFTLEFWAKTSSISTTARLLGKRSGSGTTAGYQVFLSGSKFQFLTDDGPDAPITLDDGTTRSNNTWYHVVVVRDTNTMRMYVNGVASGNTATQTGNLDDTPAFQIGTVDSTAFFGGQIDEVAVYNTALSAGQVLTHYNSGIGVTNHTPTVSSLGPSDLVDGSTTNDNTPTLQFTTADSDADNVSYTLQVDNNSDFSSPTYTVTSSPAPAGAVSATTNTLPDGSYYWRVLVGDGIATSTYSTANSGQVAFVVDTTAPTLHITTPGRSVAASSTVATISYVDQKGNTVYIPYIQTSTTLSVAASAGIGLVPVSGGVKFVLNEGLPSQQISYDMSSPYTSSFTGLAKGTYTLDVYVVDSGQVVVSGSSNHDTAIGIGIGDIYVAIGDSITKGAQGVSSTGCIASGDITNWTQSLPGTVSTDNRNYCQWSLQQPMYFKSWMPELNNELTAYNGYPVFILNEGYGGYTAAGYLTSPMGGASWQSRVTGLHPNKFLILLGTNDNSSTSTLVANMTSIINTLESTYGASASSIYLGLPLYASSRAVVQTYIAPLQALVTSAGTGAGPNFNTYFFDHPELYADSPPIHPTVAGYLQMARLWALSMLSPKNLTVSQNAGTITVSWDSFSSYDAIPNGISSITGYNVKYGTSSGNYSTTVDVGNVTTKTITGLSNNQQYFFTVQAYGADQETSKIASETSLTYISDSTSPTTTSSPLGGYYSTTQSVTLSCVDNIGGAGCDKTYYTTNGDVPTTGSTQYTTTPISITGTTVLKFFSTDLNGNSESYKTQTYTFDTTGPTGTISNGNGTPTNSVTPTLNLTIADAGIGIAGAQMRFSCDNSTWSSWESYATPKTNFNVRTGAGCTDADGSKTVYVEYKDSLGNVGSSYNTGAFTLDTSASFATLSGTPASITKSTSASVTVAGTNIVSYEYKIDSGSYGTETVIATPISLSGLADGSHTLSVIGKNSAGTWQVQGSATTYTWTVDTTAPVVTFSIPTTSNSLTVTFNSFSATDANSVTGYLVNEAATAPAIDNAGWSGTAQTQYVFTTDGAKTLYAWAKDSAGNISTSGSGTVTVTTTHTITASSGANGSISPSGSVSVNNGSDQAFTITPNSGYHIDTVTADSVAVSATSPYTFTNVTADHIISATFAADVVVSHSGGGGMIIGWNNLPITPTGGFKIFVNSGASTTTNRIVNLNFNAGSDVKKMAISLTGDFNDASQENYSPTKQIDLCSKFGGLIKNPTCPNGKYTIYSKFYTFSGVASPVATSSITLTNGTTNTTKYNFTRNLSLHATGADVKALQQFLNANGFVIAKTGAGSLGKETSLFGALTYKALVKFQKSIGWSGTGFFGPMTRQYIANH